MTNELINEIQNLIYDITDTAEKFIPIENKAAFYLSIINVTRIHSLNLEILIKNKIKNYEEKNEHI